MSVLVEAISIVIARHVLDEKFPGGTDGFLRVATRAPGARWAVADERVACASFETLEEGQRFVEPLRQAGFDGAPDPVAFVDQYFGPTGPCRWLRWRRNDEGFTSCWLEGAEPGELAAPARWQTGRAAAGMTVERAASETPPPEYRERSSERLPADVGLLSEEYETLELSEPMESPERAWAEAEEDAALDGGASESTLLPDELPPRLPSSGWDPTEPVRDDATELGEGIRTPPQGLFEPLHLGSALAAALSSAPEPVVVDASVSAQVEWDEETPSPVVESRDDADLELPRMETPRGVENVDAHPVGDVADGGNLRRDSSPPMSQPVSARPPVGDGWDDEEGWEGEYFDEASPGEQAIWGSVPQLATEEEDWWDGAGSPVPEVPPARAPEPPTDEEVAARVAAFEAQFIGEEPEELGSTPDEVIAEQPISFGEWLPPAPAASNGSQPTPVGGTALLEAEEANSDLAPTVGHQRVERASWRSEPARVERTEIEPPAALQPAVQEEQVEQIDDGGEIGPVGREEQVQVQVERVANVVHAGWTRPARDQESEEPARALASARSVLEARGWLLGAGANDRGALLFQVRGNKAHYQGRVSLDADAGALRINTLLPTCVPQAMRSQVAELLLRAAPSLPLGAFELDFESGEMRCRVAADLDGAPMTEARMARLLDDGVAACDQYHDATMLVVYAGRSVKDALSDLQSQR